MIDTLDIRMQKQLIHNDEFLQNSDFAEYKIEELQKKKTKNYRLN